MNENRRRFLRHTALSGTAAAGAITFSPAVPAVDAAAARHAEPDLPKGKSLATILRGTEWRLACNTPQGVLDVVGAGHALGVAVPQTMDDLFAQGGGRAVDDVVSRAMLDNRMRRHFLVQTQVRFGPALLNPEKILMVGLNYRKHAAELGQPLPRTPLLFNKYNNTLMGHGGLLHLPSSVASQFDHEVELVVVIGRRASHVTEQDALSYVGGYCTGNDFSARDLQRVTSQFMLGKTCDGFAPLGPWLVTADLVSNPNALDLWCDVNGERRQASNTSDMVFNCAQLVSYVSRHMTLQPGDILYTGTPEGVIAGRPEGERVWLKAGDVVACGVQGLGELRVTLADGLRR
jgi:2-keto-4-pentenoate hydratase/2-oxohepta-3-ene-1,7-dioic acid hydratase in catechol pathway